MAKTFLEYYKLILSKVSFDKSLLMKEYRKALKFLNPSEQQNLTSWLNSKGVQLQPIKNNK